MPSVRRGLPSHLPFQTYFICRPASPVKVSLTDYDALSSMTSLTLPERSTN
jgi:hypothetical protein